ncbi:MAG: protein TolQ [Pseudomonadota bacterium]
MAMFARATPTVQAVMIVLVAVSFWSWAIIIEKARMLRRLGREARDFEGRFWSGGSIDDLYGEVSRDPISPIERVFVAGMEEWRRSFGPAGRVLRGTEARVDRAMAATIQREAAGFQRRLPFLATVGSVSPFVGLFATVWGIKHSFEAIAIQQNTNLAVVAPGIAEALLATAMGLIAAIPATVAFNRLSAEADGLSEGLEGFSDEFLIILSREIDREQSGLN